MIDLSAEYRVNRWATVYFTGRNIFDVGQEWMESPPGVAQGKNPISRHYESYGSLWHFGVKGTF